MTVAWSAPGVVDSGVVARIEELEGQGLDDRAISAELDVSLRTLQRIRAALRQPAPVPPSPAARRMRGRGDRTKWVQVRVSEEELAELKRLAGIAGMSVGEYVRRQALVELPVDVAYDNIPTTIMVGARTFDGNGSGVPDVRQRAAHEAGHLVHGFLNHLPVIEARVEVQPSGALGGGTRTLSSWGEDQKATDSAFLGYIVAGEVATEVLLGEAAPGARCAGPCKEHCANDTWCDFATAVWRVKQDLTGDSPLVSELGVLERIAAAREEVLGVLRADETLLRWTWLKLLEPPHAVTKEELETWRS